MFFFLCENIEEVLYAQETILCFSISKTASHLGGQNTPACPPPLIPPPPIHTPTQYILT